MAIRPIGHARALAFSGWTSSGPKLCCLAKGLHACVNAPAYDHSKEEGVLDGALPEKEVF
eukprot:10186734-Alexandrium_andersonii.AAC.1